MLNNGMYGPWPIFVTANWQVAAPALLGQPRSRFPSTISKKSWTRNRNWSQSLPGSGNRARRAVTQSVRRRNLLPEPPGSAQLSQLNYWSWLNACLLIWILDRGQGQLFSQLVDDRHTYTNCDDPNFRSSWCRRCQTSRNRWRRSLIKTS